MGVAWRGMAGHCGAQDMLHLFTRTYVPSHSLLLHYRHYTGTGWTEWSAWRHRSRTGWRAVRLHAAEGGEVACPSRPHVHPCRLLLLLLPPLLQQ